MSVDVDFSALEVMFNEAVYRMFDSGEINKDQRDALIDLLEHIDEYSEAEFFEAWESVTGALP